jgi:predicted TIM-barrel fold metal-dependent hydrolase
MLLHEFQPHPALVTPVTAVARPRFPVIDAHNHLGPHFGEWTGRPLAELLERMDAAGVRRYADLDGGFAEELFHSHLDYFKQPAPERFEIFAGVSWQYWPEHGDRFGEWAAQKLREHARQGAAGLKVWKNFGLHVRDQHDRRVSVDDARLDPLWATAGELGLPVTMHVADPVAFFDPLDIHNERWEELQAHPDWHFLSPPFPPFQSIVNGMSAVVMRHPATTFIGAHVGCYAENLAWVGALMERCPNFYVDISARIGELGRQPYAARRFFMQHAGRILFGIDSGPEPAVYRRYARFLETADEYFAYGEGAIPGQGRWQIYGLYLPDDVLEKVYYRNAERLFQKTAP